MSLHTNNTQGGSRMSWRQFARALPMVARQRGWQPDEAASLVAACPGPQLNSEASTSRRQSSFTGRSGSYSGSRPPSVPASSDAAGTDDETASVGSHGTPGRVGAFTPTKRASADRRLSGGSSPPGSTGSGSKPSPR